MATREKKIFAELEHDIGAVVLTNGSEPNLDLTFFYVTGITSGLFEECLAIIKRNGVEVVSSQLEELSSRQAGVKTTVFGDSKRRQRLLTDRIKGMKKIGVNFREITHTNYAFVRKCAKGAKLVDVSEAIGRARMIKDEDEVSRIKRACDITSKTARAIPDIVKAGMTETEAAAELNYMMMRLGSSGPGFETNASFGPTTAEPHYVPAARRLAKGNLALFDFGARYKKYVADLTRTYVSGKPSKRQRGMYDIVLEAQLAAIDAIRDGAHGKDIDSAARKIIDSSPYKGKFIHGTGHGIGVSVHDPGYISSRKDMILKEGMVLTVEPGVYVKNFGGVRIEDDVLVTKKGCRILTSAPKEFISI
jgi:Xaa-Pro dipeptidase